MRGHFGDHIEHSIRPIGGHPGQQNFELLRKPRREIGEIVRRSVGVGQHQRGRAENLRRIALRFEAAIALRAIALNEDADIGNGADETVGQQEIEMGGFAGCGDRAAEQTLVDERADDSLLAGAVGRHHNIEQKACRPRSGRQPPHVDDGGKIGAAEHFGCRRRHAQLIETDAVGRQRHRRGVADRRLLDAAAGGQQRIGEQPSGAHHAAVGHQKRRRTRDANGGDRSHRARIARQPRDRIIDDADSVGQRADQNEPARPPSFVVALGEFRQRAVAVIERNVPAAGDQRSRQP